MEIIDNLNNIKYAKEKGILNILEKLTNSQFLKIKTLNLDLDDVPQEILIKSCEDENTFNFLNKLNRENTCYSNLDLLPAIDYNCSLFEEMFVNEEFCNLVVNWQYEIESEDFKDFIENSFKLIKENKFNVNQLSNLLKNVVYRRRNLKNNIVSKFFKNINLCRFNFVNYYQIKSIETSATLFDKWGNEEMFSKIETIYNSFLELNYEEMNNVKFNNKNIDILFECYDDIIKLCENKISRFWVMTSLQYSILDQRNIVKMLNNFKNNNFEKNVFKVLYNNDKLEILFKDEEIINFKKEFVLNNIKKKNLINIILNNIDKYKIASPSSVTERNNHSILFDKRVSEIINLNSINEKNFEFLIDKKLYIKNRFLDIMPKNITFKEFEFLLDKDTEELITLFKKLVDLKVERRLILLKQLPNLRFKEINIDEVENLIRTKSLGDRINELNKIIPIKNCSKDDYLLYFLNEEKMSKYVLEIGSGLDIEFIFDNMSKLGSYNTLLEMKKDLLIQSSQFKKFKDLMQFSDDFIEKNMKNLLDFNNQDLIFVSNRIMDNKRLETFQKENFKLIVKAELSNKLREFKFRKEDFEKEIGLILSEEQRNVWINNNKSKTSKYEIEETYSFDDIIRLGEFPVKTCQHWSNGSYSESLLSNFDTNKKMIVVKNENGLKNTRCLLRLTKTTNTRNIKKNNLRFIDIDIEEDIQDTKVGSKEELMLFVEKTYSSLDYKDLIEVEAKIIELALEKAKQLNAKLFISDYFEGEVINKVFGRNISSKGINTFISYSKNGVQYLDSLNGRAHSNEEGTYNLANGWLI